MGVRFFRGQRTRFEHEFRQQKEIARVLRKEFPHEQVYLITNVLVANGQIDCIILTRNGPVVLDLKAFKGEIRGRENGKWEVSAKDGDIPLPNLFSQARMHRQDFIDVMIPITRKYFPHIGEQNLRKIGSWLYFCKGSTYPEGQIDFRRVKWFRIVTAEDLTEKLRFIDSGYTFRPEDMDAIVHELRLQEYSLWTDRPVVPQAAKPAAKSKLPAKKWIALIVLLLALAVLVGVVLVVPGLKVAAINLLQGVLSMTGGVVQSISKDALKSNSTPYDSQQAIVYLNGIRVNNAMAPVPFEQAAYDLAMARAQDMNGFGYLGYTNPDTGESAPGLQELYGISPPDEVRESVYGQWNGYTYGIEIQAIDSWLSDKGNHERLMEPYQGAAIACSGGYCSFIGVLPGVPDDPGPGGNITPAE
ncbi:uncharacterized protein YkwD [Methanolinea mesophila]|uniref:NERD domain-containing protein n=1 Tax=Methanolinea mesophila TaxID=547055 RepID=UPI001AE8A7E5|nr:NERD domain-containing protein [Methanolinea mesophila]MBP1929824.1 uncharacterized protein YkwD [Methanolinea mesophila]